MRRHRITLPAVLLLLAACLDGGRELPVSETCDGEPCIQIGTFNAYWLGGERRYGERPLRTEAEVRRIAAWLADDLDLEVIALEEVNTSIDGLVDGDVFSTAPYRWLGQALGERGYELLPGSSGGTQQVVLAYDRDEVELLAPGRELDVRDRFELSADCRRGGLRRPLAARLRAGGFDFWVVGVHLKSKRGGECSDWIREAQAQDLVAAIDGLVASSGEPDVILLGDFNAEPDHPSTAALRSPGGFRVTTDRRHQARGSGKVSYLIDPYRSLIDHVMARPEPTAEWIDGSGWVFDPGRGRELEAYNAVFSDHAPVWASFRTARDDD